MDKLVKKPLLIKEPNFWFKLVQFLVFIALVTSEMALFVGQDLNVYYGTSISKGFGLIITSVAWLAWSQLAKRTSWSKHFILEAFTMLTLIVGVCLVPHALSFALMGVILVIGAIYVFVVRSPLKGIAKKHS